MALGITGTNNRQEPRISIGTKIDNGGVEIEIIHKRRSSDGEHVDSNISVKIASSFAFVEGRFVFEWLLLDESDKEIIRSAEFEKIARIGAAVLGV